MAIPAFLILFLVSLAGALDVFSSNDQLPVQAEQLEMIFTATGTRLNAFVEPLTPEVGLGMNSVHIDSILIEGSFRSAGPFTAIDVGRADIAFVSCDLNSNSSNLSPEDIVETIVPKEPRAVAFYSLVSDHCGISDVGNYASYFTVTNTTRETIQMFIATPNASATIRSTTLSSNNSAPSETPAQTSRSPTPDVAMNILYAVTGIITVLFLVIIATGAWRAHNNPARYGPRTGVAGHPRQSRAKGLARAMLETLPIVKFGDPVPAKPDSRDIELEATTDTADTSVHVTADDQQEIEPQLDTVPVGGDGANSPPQSDTTVPTPQPTTEPPEANLGCSICTEDFTKGEDVRVLPCNHQYHPACIDPWLLNVSGTCPLCRVDLRPARTNDEASSPTDVGQTPLATPTGADQAHHSRVQRILATRHAPVQERIATLRQLATEAGQQQQNRPSIPPDTAEGTRHGRGLTDRLRDRFRIHTRTDVAPEEVSRAATTAATTTTSSPPVNNTATESTAGS